MMKFTKIQYRQYKNLKMAMSVSGMTVCMITFWITEILFHSIVLSISQTNAVSIKVLQIMQQKHLLPKDCYALFPVFTKEDSNYLYNSTSLLLSGEQSQLLTELRIKVVGEMVKNKSVHDAGNLLKHGVDNFEEDMLDSMRDKTYSSLRHIHAMTNVVCCNIRSVYPQY